MIINDVRNNLKYAFKFSCHQLILKQKTIWKQKIKKIKILMINKFIKHKMKIEIIGKIPTRGVFMLCIFNLGYQKV